MNLISVVIPVFNKERHIARAIVSVFLQEYENWELVIVDDGSTDMSVSKIQRLLLEQPISVQNRVMLLSQTNKGQYRARQRGIEASRGDFIALLDADDFWEPSKLARQIEFLNNNKSLDLVLTNYCIFYEHKGIRNLSKFYPVRLPQIETLITEWATTNGYGGLVESTGLFRKTFLASLIGSSGLEMSGGLEICLKAQIVNKVGLMSEYLCGYVKTDSGWHNNKEDLVDSYKQLLSREYLSDALKHDMRAGLEAHLALWEIRKTSYMRIEFWIKTLRYMRNPKHLIYLVKLVKRTSSSLLTSKKGSVTLSNLHELWKAELA